MGSTDANEACFKADDPVEPVGGKAEGRPRGWRTGMGAAVIVLAAAAAYGGTFAVPMLFDDNHTILRNASIRHWATALFPPVDSSADGRPVLNLSLALNYAVSQTGVWSYHAFNLAVLILSGLALYGIVRRTLQPRTPAGAGPIAFSCALLWTLHPLQTESITYIVQRAEAMAGLFYLVTLYAFIRGLGAAGRARLGWRVVSVACCLFGMASKEVMVSAPLAVLLYDRTFAAGRFGEALRRSPRFYAALFSTWILLAFLVLSSAGRHGTAGFGTHLAWWRYLLTQLPAVTRYLRLCFWPFPQVFDYGTRLVPPSLGLLAPGLVVTGLAVATLWALRRRPAAGFLGAIFFAVLAPSSSVIPIATQTVAEHRMYLASAPVVLLAVLGIHRALGRWALPACLGLAALLGLATFQRNQAYASEESIWSDTVAKAPDNARAHAALGNALMARRETQAAAVAQYREAVRLDPNYAEGRLNYGYALQAAGRRSEAIAEFRAAVRLRPEFEEAHESLGDALDGAGDTPGAVSEYEEAVRLRPGSADLHLKLGNADWRTAGRFNDAVAQFRAAVSLDPGSAQDHFNLGTALSMVPGQLPDAVSQYEEAVRLKPDFVGAHVNLGNAFSRVPGRLADAITQYEAALRLDPRSPAIHYNLALALQRLPGHEDEVRSQLREVIRLQPDNAAARQILEKMGVAP